MDELDFFRNFRRGVAAPSADAQRRASARLASAFDEVVGREKAARLRQGRRRWRLVAIAVAIVAGAALLATPALGIGDRLLSLIQDKPTPHVENGWFPSKGKRGSFTIQVVVRQSGTPHKPTRSWVFGSFPRVTMTTGQYAQVTGGGRRIVAGGHLAGSYARFFGRVSRPGGAKQRVLITFKGRPNGVFVLTPLEPGVLMRDSGTYHTFGTG